MWDGFPREVWNGDRAQKWLTICSIADFLSYCKEQRECFNPVHTSINIGTGPVLSTRYSKPWICKFLLELDGALRENYRDMRRLYVYLRMIYDANPRIYFSGDKSFHIFCDFNPLSLKESFDAQVSFAKKIMKELSVTKIDLQSYYDRKLSRVPHTIHEKTTLDCVPISPFWTLEEIKKESFRPARFEPVRINFSPRIAVAIKELDRGPMQRENFEQNKRNKNGSNKWILLLLEHPIGDGRHRVLWHILAPYAMNSMGLSFDEAQRLLADYFEKCAQLKPLQPSAWGFKREITYYLKVAKRSTFPPWRLDTIQKKDPHLYEIITNVLK